MNKISELIEWCRSPGSNVISNDWDGLEAKIQSLQRQQAEHIHILADFDMTLTKYWDENNKRTLSSHGVLEHHAINSETRTALSGLFTKYYPIEVSLTISHEEKVAAMVEWWQKAHELIIASNLTKKKLDSIIKDTKVIFRPRLKELVQLVTKLDIPMLVFSAGLGDVIHRMLSNEKLWTQDMAIVSNMMIWENDVLVGFKDPLIHVFNKDEAMVHETPHAVKVAHRDNIILLGDSIGDLKMAHGIKHGVKLTVGFLNHDVEKLKQRYLDAFDVVLTNDTSMEFMIKLIEATCH